MVWVYFFLDIVGPRSKRASRCAIGLLAAMHSGFTALRCQNNPNRPEHSKLTMCPVCSKLAASCGWHEKLRKMTVDKRSTSSTNKFGLHAVVVTEWHSGIVK